MKGGGVGILYRKYIDYQELACEQIEGVCELAAALVTLSGNSKMLILGCNRPQLTSFDKFPDCISVSLEKYANHQQIITELGDFNIEFL